MQVQQGGSPLRPGGRVCSRPLPSFWCFIGNLWCSLACRCIPTVSTFPFPGVLPECVCLCVQISPFYKSTGRIRLGAHAGDLILT